jgi:hypothetical protein
MQGHFHKFCGKFLPEVPAAKSLARGSEDLRDLGRGSAGKYFERRKEFLRKDADANCKSSGMVV